MSDGNGSRQSLEWHLNWTLETSYFWTFRETEEGKKSSGMGAA